MSFQVIAEEQAGRSLEKLIDNQIASAAEATVMHFGKKNEDDDQPFPYDEAVKTNKRK